MSPKSWIPTMCGWDNRANVRASRPKRSANAVIRHAVRRQDFQRDESAQPLLARLVDSAHSPLADQFQDFELGKSTRPDPPAPAGRNGRDLRRPSGSDADCSEPLTDETPRAEPARRATRRPPVAPHDAHCFFSLMACISPGRFHPHPGITETVREGYTLNRGSGPRLIQRGVQCPQLGVDLLLARRRSARSPPAGRRGTASAGGAPLP